MNKITYQIEFFTYWHASSGLYGSTYADLLVNKTEDGLPFLPGKTLKGLLREAAETIHQLHPTLVTKEFINDVFGVAPKKGEEEKYRIAALSFFSNGELSKLLQESIGKSDQSFLYDVLSSTKIDKKGIAVNHSLRQLEVTIPLTLYASIEQFPDKEGYKKQLEYCMKFTKKMGMNRSRGLGRCQFSIL